MLKNSGKSYIIILITVVLLAGLTVKIPAEVTGEFEIRPRYEFKYKAERDPFYPPYKKDPYKKPPEVDVTTFTLVGITESGGIKTALFVSKGGRKLGYIFTNGRLYAENNMKITGVEGEIKGSQEVVLIQGDNEVVFELADNLQGPNIGP